MKPALTRAAQRARDGGSQQTRMDSFYLSYHDNARFGLIRSERLRGAVADITGSGAPPGVAAAAPPCASSSLRFFDERSAIATEGSKERESLRCVASMAIF